MNNKSRTIFATFLLVIFSISHSESPPKTIYFAVLSLYDPYQTYQEFQPLIDYISREADVPIDFYFATGYLDAVKALGEGRAQLAYLGGITYLQARKYYHAIPLVQPLNEEGQPFYHSLLIASEKSSIKSVFDLQNQKICFGSTLSTSGYWVPRYMLLQQKSPFPEKQYCGYYPHHIDIIKSVINGECSAGFIKDVVIKNRSYTGIKVVLKSELIPSYPIVASPSLQPALREKIQKVLGKLTANEIKKIPFYNQLSNEFKHGFVRSNDNHFDSLRTLLQALSGTEWPEQLSIH
ncbi:MAG: phosphate/phosphite/phosphonate ABC transporter substrate-binding protein [Fibrobacteria bacterium]|nr:phosphate/phosphite/phosphonate ABC transporter substrate-binding protein [Fibrobacteria bacterium]